MLETGLIVYFALNFIVVLLLGFYQQQTRLQALPCDTEEEKARDQHDKLLGISAVILILVQAIVTLIALQSTSLFPFGASLVGFVLLCHHAVIHAYSDFSEDPGCSCSAFQCKDIANHETWVVAAIVAAGVSWLRL